MQKLAIGGWGGNHGAPTWSGGSDSVPPPSSPGRNGWADTLHAIGRTTVDQIAHPDRSLGQSILNASTPPSPFSASVPGLAPPRAPELNHGFHPSSAASNGVNLSQFANHTANFVRSRAQADAANPIGSFLQRFGVPLAGPSPAAAPVPANWGENAERALFSAPASFQQVLNAMRAETGLSIPGAMTAFAANDAIHRLPDYQQRVQAYESLPPEWAESLRNLHGMAINHYMRPAGSNAATQEAPIHPQTMPPAGVMYPLAPGGNAQNPMDYQGLRQTAQRYGVDPTSGGFMDWWRTNHSPGQDPSHSLALYLRQQAHQQVDAERAYNPGPWNAYRQFMGYSRFDPLTGGVANRASPTGNPGALGRIWDAARTLPEAFVAANPGSAILPLTSAAATQVSQWSRPNQAGGNPWHSYARTIMAPLNAAFDVDMLGGIDSLTDNNGHPIQGAGTPRLSSAFLGNPGNEPALMQLEANQQRALANSSGVGALEQMSRGGAAEALESAQIMNFLRAFPAAGQLIRPPAGGVSPLQPLAAMAPVVASDAAEGALRAVPIGFGNDSATFGGWLDHHAQRFADATQPSNPAGVSGLLASMPGNMAVNAAGNPISIATAVSQRNVPMLLQAIGTSIFPQAEQLAAARRHAPGDEQRAALRNFYESDSIPNIANFTAQAAEARARDRWQNRPRVGSLMLQPGDTYQGAPVSAPTIVGGQLLGHSSASDLGPTSVFNSPNLVPETLTILNTLRSENQQLPPEQRVSDAELQQQAYQWVTQALSPNMWQQNHSLPVFPTIK